MTTWLIAPLTELSDAILLTLLDGDLDGYGMMKAVETQSHGRIRPGAASLHAALDRLIRDGLIDEWVADVDGSAQPRFALIDSAGRKRGPRSRGW
jgi:DNA-binding PadR family transcriptional regulator